jgi:hypothetical protein
MRAEGCASTRNFPYLYCALFEVNYRQWDGGFLEGSLPGFKAIVVALQRDLAISKFEEHGKMRFHLRTGG